MSWNDDFFNFDFFFTDDYTHKRVRTNTSSGVDKRTAHVNRKDILYFVIFVLLVAALFIFIKCDEERDYNAHRREKAAINMVDKLLSKPYYVHKSDFEAQKDLMHPALLGMRIDMPFSSKEMKKKDFFKYASFGVSEFLLSGYESTDSIMGTTDYFCSGNYNNGKLLKMRIQFDYHEDGKDVIIVERIKKWAGKGCFVTYNTNERKNEYEWQYKNANIKLTYSSKSLFLTLEQPGLAIQNEVIEKADSSN